MRSHCLTGSLQPESIVFDDFKSAHQICFGGVGQTPSFHIPADFLVAESGDSIPRSETVNNVVKMTP
jgi:hypothetical protein